MMRRWSSRSSSSFVGFFGLLLASTPTAQVGTVAAEQNISETMGGFGGVLDPVDHFGAAVAAVGDLDGDGVVDFAVGAPDDDDGGMDQGAVWILFLDSDGTVAAQSKISETSGGFAGVLVPDDRFGISVAALGDLDGNGVGDIAVGALADSEVAFKQGAVWILFLNADGTVAAHQKIGEATGGFGGDLNAEDFFGASVTALGDLDGDGIVDLAVGATGDDDGGTRQGAVWILFLNADGTVTAQQKISETAGGFGGSLDPFDTFGESVAGLGDLDGDGNRDLAVGALEDDEGGNNAGALWIVFLNPDGAVAAQQKITEGSGGFGGSVGQRDRFGASVAALGDLDGDGVGDLAVGASWDSSNAFQQEGSVWILFLRTDGTVVSERKITEGTGGFQGTLETLDLFGTSVAALGDLDGDGGRDLAVGVFRDNDGGFNQGSVWILFLQGPEPCLTLDFETDDDFSQPLVNGQHLDVELDWRVSATSSGANAGIGVFDSTPGGPNDAGPDPDLLVDSGNLLVLQSENFPPDPDDVFPVPDDDDDGGALTFAFPAPVEARSVRLVDIDANTAASVVLTDSSARVRTYTVPADWTGDLTLLQPGHGTLDLVTLAPQPGFGSTATAAEDAGFDPGATVNLEVQLAGPGAIDDLVWCRPGMGLAQASSTVRNGTGVNPLLLSNVATPVVNGTWAARIDCTGHASGLAHLLVTSTPITMTTSLGEILVAGPPLLQQMRPHAGSFASFTQSVPNDLSLVGVSVSAQGVCFGGGCRSRTRSTSCSATELERAPLQFERGSTSLQGSRETCCKHGGDSPWERPQCSMKRRSQPSLSSRPRPSRRRRTQELRTSMLR
jgi:hypothetical protein